MEEMENSTFQIHSVPTGIFWYSIKAGAEKGRQRVTRRRKLQAEKRYSNNGVVLGESERERGK